MEVNTDTYVQETNHSMAKAIQFLESELSKVRAGKASTHMLDGIHVPYYEVDTPLSQVANINATDAKTLVVHPWEKDMLKHIEKAIIGANLGITPLNDGTVIRLVVPPLTEERRIDLVKQVKNLGEQSKVAIRNIRRDANVKIKQLQNEGLSEDMAKDTESKIQKSTDEYIDKVDKHLAAKETEIMTV